MERLISMMMMAFLMLTGCANGGYTESVETLPVEQIQASSINEESTIEEIGIEEKKAEQMVREEAASQEAVEAGELKLRVGVSELTGPLADNTSTPV